MEDNLLNSGDVQRLIKLLMKEKYAYEQHIADTALNCRRQGERRSSDLHPTKGRQYSGMEHPNCLLRCAQGNEGGSTHNSFARFGDAASINNVCGDGSRKQLTESLRSRLSSEPCVWDTGLVDGAESLSREREKKKGQDSVLLSQRKNIFTEHLSFNVDGNCSATQPHGMGGDYSLNTDANVSICTTKTKDRGLEFMKLKANSENAREVPGRLDDSVTMPSVAKAGNDCTERYSDTISELPDNPNELGKTAEEKILSVIAALAKRVRLLEVDLDTSLQQLRVMEAAAIERDMDLKRTKVSRDEIEEIVTRLVTQRLR